MLSTSPSSLLQHPSLKSLNLNSHFIHGSSPIHFLKKPFSSLSISNPSSSSILPPIRAMKSMQGRVLCATNDKTVKVEIVRLAPHPKYKRRIRIKKKYQAHDPDNQFKVGDIVQLEKCRPISKTKSFLAVAVAARDTVRKTQLNVKTEELGLPLESEKIEFCNSTVANLDQNIRALSVKLSVVELAELDSIASVDLWAM